MIGLNMKLISLIFLKIKQEQLQQHPVDSTHNRNAKFKLINNFKPDTNESDTFHNASHLEEEQQQQHEQEIVSRRKRKSIVNFLVLQLLVMSKFKSVLKCLHFFK